MREFAWLLFTSFYFLGAIIPCLCLSRSQWDAHGDDGSGGGGALDDEITASARSYEELVRTHVDAYVASSDAYGAESRLSRRVAEWQTRLQPTLDEEDARPTFDIQLYGQRVYVLDGGNCIMNVSVPLAA